ncbi:MAG: hypothetical protein KF709_09960 [Gemmatimonadaceae bacterium]|nr:hypothetical protein [Gemmatimonadaceae bacterium]
MRSTLRSLTTAALLGGTALALAATSAQAQAGTVRRAPERPGAAASRPLGVTELLNARRALELTPRQVAQLDSIERVLFADRQRTGAAMREQQERLRTELRQRTERGERPAATQAGRDSLRAAMQQRMQALRPQMEQLRQRDSVSRAAAERVLNDAQRQKVREMQAERRGYERAMQQRGARGGVRGAGPARGARPGQRPGAAMAPRGQAGPPDAMRREQVERRQREMRDRRPPV